MCFKAGTIFPGPFIFHNYVSGTTQHEMLSGKHWNANEASPSGQEMGYTQTPVMVWAILVFAFWDDKTLERCAEVHSTQDVRWERGCCSAALKRLWK